MFSRSHEPATPLRRNPEINSRPADNPDVNEMVQAINQANTDQIDIHLAKQKLLNQRILELENQLQEYEKLLAELPEVFERKFQQRLEPLLESYRLLAQSQNGKTSTDPIKLEGRHPMRLPSLLRARWQANEQSESQRAA